MKSTRLKNSPDKNRSLEPFREYPHDATLTTDQGVQIEQTDDSLRGGSCGPQGCGHFARRYQDTSSGVY